MSRVLLVVTLSLSLLGCSILAKDPDPTSGRHTRMTLQVAAGAEVEGVRKIIEARTKASGFNAKVVAEGERGLIVSVQGEVDEARLRELAAAGALRFRKVIDTADGSGAAPPAPSPGPPDPQPQPSGSPGLPPQPKQPSSVREFQDSTVTCAQLAAEPMAGRDDDMIVACDPNSYAKYLLDRAKVTGADVSRANTAHDSHTGQWVVEISFTKSGQSRWTDLTREASENSSGGCVSTGDSGRCLIAIVVDGTVISAPEILEVLTGDAHIAGAFTGDQAKRLAAQISEGELPVPVEVVKVEVVG